jgi:hypothetical protein
VEKSNGIILLPLDSDLNVFYGFLIWPAPQQRVIILGVV